ncbi:nucleotidyltransferase domain-containing protein [Microvirga sp. P5_D2]
MTIPEAQLDTWSGIGSVAQSRDTYATIKSALEASDAAYAGKDYSVFLQGSYGNDTNVYAESDVDVVIVLNDIYFHDIENLSGAEKASFNQAWVAASYSYTDFKRDVLAQLRRKFGQQVDPGDKAIAIPASGNRRKADVIVAAQFRRYHQFQSLSNEAYTTGICFWNGSGVQIANYPKQHSENLTTKHQATASWLKPTIRIFKNMRNRMVADGKIEAGLAPSYYLEGLLYNVPADKFGRNHSDTFVNCFNYVNSADRSNFVCANEQYYLLREGTPVTWRAEKCTTFLNAVAKYWNDW